MQTTIRAATVDDARAIAEVDIASWKATYAEILDLENLPLPLELEERRRLWAQVIPLVGEEGFRTWVAEIDGVVRGFAFTRPSKDDDMNPLEVAQLVALYLHPDLFGHGLGKVLLERAVAGMRNQGFLQATLWVLEENTRAIHFYRREGWKADGARAEDFMGLGAAAVRYRLPL